MTEETPTQAIVRLACELVAARRELAAVIEREPFAAWQTAAKRCDQVMAELADWVEFVEKMQSRSR